MADLYKDLAKVLDNKTLDYSYRDFEAESRQLYEDLELAKAQYRLKKDEPSKIRVQVCIDNIKKREKDAMEKFRNRELSKKDIELIKESIKRAIKN